MSKIIEEIEFDLDNEDLQHFKAICKAMLEANIAVKSFQLRHARKVEFKKMQKESIRNSKKGLELLETIENAESINDLIRRGVGDKQWFLLVNILGVFSGSLCDPDFYEFDKSITEAKKKEVN